MFKKLMVQQRLLAAGLCAGLLALAGCGSMTAEDFKSILGGVTDAAQSVGQFEANRRANKPAPAAANSNSYAQAAAPQQASTYGPLSCARLTQRSGAMCMENGCGRMVSLHARSGNGAMGSLAVGPGQCMPIVPGTAQAVACSGADRFDWGRSACVSS